MSPGFLPGLMEMIELGETSEGAAWSGPGSQTVRGGVESLIVQGKQKVVSVVQVQQGKLASGLSTVPKHWLAPSSQQPVHGTPAA